MKELIETIDITEPVPLWLAELRKQCQVRGQRVVAEEIGVSRTMVCQALQGKYPGDLARLERAVRGAYLGATVICPVLGEISTHKCLQHQKEKLSAVNPMRVQLFRACNGSCPNSEKNKEK